MLYCPPSKFLRYLAYVNYTNGIIHKFDLNKYEDGQISRLVCLY